ncbi:N-acetylneuraminate synthase [Lunatibacter salilacus]|uniref:N-acetylneuraminate synthase n=1 Tax=Lunatibacter salilacus TaxID=2483804 RepID=UPI00131B6D66|nr:N-acetylneuraminate synthase [Lunatibacter salilacus]
MDRVIIIAEAGVNHNGDLNLAKELIQVAADAGADYVKFQTFNADKLVSKAAKKAAYQSKNFKDADDSQYNMLKKLEMPEDWYSELLQFSADAGIKFLSTGFDEESIDFLDQIGLELFKIPSGEITNKPYLKHVALKGKPIILSTGMANIQEISQALAVFESCNRRRDEITVLHCNTEYPTPMKDVNLKAMLHIRDELKVAIGYSDHTLGIEVPIAAVALGAGVIEKHFTLDRSLPGPDHKASLEPGELKDMVRGIRNIELAISGSGIKSPSDSEIPNKIVARKSIFFIDNISVGDIITKERLTVKRPGNGISPMDIDQIIGKKVSVDVPADTMVEWSQIQ